MGKVDETMPLQLIYKQDAAMETLLCSTPQCRVKYSNTRHNHQVVCTPNSLLHMKSAAIQTLPDWDLAPQEMLVAAGSVHTGLVLLGCCLAGAVFGVMCH